MTAPTLTPDQAAEQARAILTAEGIRNADQVPGMGWTALPSDHPGAVVRVRPDGITTGAAVVDVLALRGNPEAAAAVLTACAETFRAAGWYVLPLARWNFRTAPGELPTPPGLILPPIPAEYRARAVELLDVAGITRTIEQEHRLARALMVRGG